MDRKGAKALGYASNERNAYTLHGAVQKSRLIMADAGECWVWAQ